MDVLDEINGHIEDLCAVAERERDRILDEMLSIHWASARELTQLALDYAEWNRILDGYRGMLRRGDAPIARVK